MGRYVFKLPDVGEGTAEAEIVAWHVKVGDAVGEDQNLVDVMTDKATVEMTSPVSGKVVSVHGEPGQMAAVGSPLVELEVEGEGNVKPGAAPAAKTEAPKPAAKPEPKPEPRKPKAAEVVPLHRAAEPQHGMRTVTTAMRKPGDKPVASPAVRERAHELGIALQYVAGSGPAGRITHQDLDNCIASGGRNAGATRASVYAQRDGTEEIKVIGLRRKIAEK